MAPANVPAVIASYAFLAQTFQDFPTFLDSDIPFSFRSAAKELERGFDRVECDITRRLAFGTQVELVAAKDQPANQRVIRWMDDGASNLLVITSHIENLKEKTIVVLSSVSPRRTSLLLVSPDLSAELIYDSLVKPEPVGEAPMGTIVEIRTAREGLRLVEKTPGLARREYEMRWDSVTVRRVRTPV